MVPAKKKGANLLVGRICYLSTVMSFRRSKLRSLAAVVSSSRRRRNGAIAVGETVLRRPTAGKHSPRQRFQEEKRTKVREAPSKLR